MFITDESIAKSGVGPGDEVYMIGMFSGMPGQSRNLPIVRSGNIALLPSAGELLPGVSLGGRSVNAEAHLIEARSIGGLSGSPVFVRTSVTMDVPVQDHVSFGGQPRMMRCQVPGQSFFLGMIHGHWSILPEDRNDPTPSFTNDKDQDKVNFGLAVVVPAKKIREVLYHPELVEIRRKSDQEYLDARGPTTPD